MNKNEEHIDFFNKLETNFEKSDEDLWKQIEHKTSNSTKIITLNKTWVKYAVAASVILLISTAFFMKFYTTTITSTKGEHYTALLPDGSTVELNAETKISYQPYWWMFNRQLKLNGEAFFEVEKGQKFTVISEEGTTEVLGTSFNIYARNNEYKVYCTTGKVKVSSNKSDIQYEITPGELAVIDNISKTGSKSEQNEANFISWKENKFNFEDVNLNSIFLEIERQFDVLIIVNNDLTSNKNFTGYFEKLDNVEDVLEMICSVYNFKYQKIDDKKYKIVIE